MTIAIKTNAKLNQIPSKNNNFDKKSRELLTKRQFIIQHQNAQKTGALPRFAKFIVEH